MPVNALGRWRKRLAVDSLTRPDGSEFEVVSKVGAVAQRVSLEGNGLVSG